MSASVSYNPSDVKGYETNWVTSHRFTDVATPYYPSARRYDDIADKVSLPPNSKVDVSMWVWNYTTHDVYVDSADLFMSKTNPSDGDVTRLGAGGSYGSTSWNLTSGQDSRSGKKVSVPVKSNFSYHANDLGKVIYSFDTIQPIQLVRVTPNYYWDGPSLKVGYEVFLKNVSSYDLCNINVHHVMANGEVHDENICINANSSYFFSYTANIGTNYPLNISDGLIKITDPNRHTEIVASPSNTSSKDIGSIVVWRDDKDHSSPAGTYGAQPGWGNTRGTFGVELIPYSFDIKVAGMNMLTQIINTETITNLTAIKNGRTSQVNSKEFLPGDEIQYKYYLRNLGTSVPRLNFAFDIEKDNKIYDQEIISSVINDTASTVSTNKLESNDKVDIYIPEFGLGQEREISIVYKILNVNFDKKKKELENYDSEIQLANELKSNVNITNSTNSDNIHYDTVLNMKLADANINIKSDKLVYDNFEIPQYDFELINNSKYKVSLSPVLTLTNQESEDISKANIFPKDSISLSENSNLKYSLSTKFANSTSQTDARLALESSFVDENLNTYPVISKSIIVGVLNPNIQVTKRIAGGDNYTIGDTIGYEIEIENIGDGIARDVHVEDILSDAFVLDLKNIKAAKFDADTRILSWDIGDIESKSKYKLRFTLSVNSDGSLSNGDKLLNFVSAKASNEVNTKKAESIANLYCANIVGFAWLDVNRNQIIDPFEKLLSNQSASVNIKWSNTSEQIYSSSILLTDSNGKFKQDCVPYGKVIKVIFTKPLEYSSLSSPIEYSFIFNNPLVNGGVLIGTENIELESNVEIVNSEAKEVLMGVYNEEIVVEPKILAVTGESTNFGLLTSLIFLIPSGLVILKRFKFKKFKSEI